MRNTAKKATVRLSDIAKETGYSLSTVSKALNGRRFRRDAANHQRGVETVWVFP
jgi:transcriptional regulator with XRE-family HTH domain